MPILEHAAATCGVSCQLRKQRRGVDEKRIRCIKFLDGAGIENENAIGINHRVQAVGDGKDSPVGEFRPDHILKMCHKTA